MKEVVEFLPNKNKIVTGNHLKFPNVQSCVALIAQVPNAQVAGAHLTIATRNNPKELGKELTTAFKGCTEVFVIGGISSGNWSKQNLRKCCSGIKRFTQVPIRKYDTSEHIDHNQPAGGVDIFAQPGGGSPEIEWVAKSGTRTQLERSSFEKI